LLGQLSDHAAEAAHHFQGHFFVEFLRQYFNGQTLGFLGWRQVGVLLTEQEDLRQYLVGERAVHDAARVTGGVAQVHQTAFGQQDQVVIVLCIERARAGTVDLVNLWLHFFPRPVLAHESGVDFVVEVADVADNSALLQGFEHVRVANVDVTGGGHDQVDLAQQRFVDARFGAVVDTVDERRNQFETVHAGLHGADRVNFGNLDDHAFLTQGLGGALAHVTVTDDQRLLAGQQVVGTTLDRIVQAVTAAVLVVVLGLGHRVVDVDRRDFQLALGQHVQQAVNASGSLFGHAVNAIQYLWVLVVQQLSQVAAVVEDHVGVPWLAIFQDGLLQAPLVLFFSLAFPGENRDAGGSDGRSGLILSRENVAGRPAYFGTQGNQGFDQHGSLNGHVDAAENFRALEWLLGGVLAAQTHEGRHFRLGDDGFATAPGSQGHVGNFVIVKICRRDNSAHEEPPFVMYANGRRCAFSVRPWPVNAPSEPDRLILLQRPSDRWRENGSK